MPTDQGAMMDRHVVVVGAGPSGIYAAEELARVHGCAVDVIDRLPTPYGLLRYGVAPDHVKMKLLVRSLERVFALPRVRFFGNVELGRDVTADDLRHRYDAVVYANGAPGHRRLGIPGEDLRGVVPAPDLVAWYSGHPDAPPPPPLQEVTTAVVVGAGNVALDIARILAKSSDELHETDAPDSAIRYLAASSIRDIHVVGRRGPDEVRFTVKELTEMGELANATVVVHAPTAELAALRAEAPARTATTLGLFEEWSRWPATDRPRTVHFHFGLAPKRIEGDADVDAITFVASGSGQRTSIAAQLVVPAIGSLGRGLPGVPFDAVSGTIPTDAGRVIRDDGCPPREYAVGWAKRGPSGVIGTNKADAMATVQVVVEDLAHRSPTQARPLEADELGAPVLWDGWLGIDGAELDRGRSRGAARVKLSTWADLLGSATASGRA